MGSIFGMPKMPDPSEMARQQLETQRSLQADADKRSTAQLEAERKKAKLRQIRASAKRRGISSLISKRDIAGGLFGAEDVGQGAYTIAPLGTDITSQISNT